MKPTMARERRAIDILEKKKWLTGLFITKSLNLQAEECTFKPRVNITSVPQLSEKGNQIQYGPWGKNMEMGEKKTFFFPPLIFYKFFCHK